MMRAILTSLVGIIMIFVATSVWEQSSTVVKPLPDVADQPLPDVSLAQTVCAELTRDCFTQDPRWNPTERLGLLLRQTPGNEGIFAEDSDVVIQKRDGYQIMHLNDAYLPEACPEDVLKAGPDQDGSVFACPSYQLNEYNEFAILSSDGSEVLHYVILDQGYTLIDVSHGSHRLSQFVEWGIHFGFGDTNRLEAIDTDRTISFIPNFHDTNASSGRLIAGGSRYHINLNTGHAIEEKFIFSD